MRRTHARGDRVSSPDSDAPPSRSADPGSGAPVPASQVNERFRLLFDRASVGIISVDKEGRAVEANPAVERMLGYDPGEMIGVSFTTFTHADDVAVSKQLYREMVEHDGGSYQYEKRYVRKDGEVIWCRVSVWRDGGAEDSGQVAIAMIEDITQAKLAEQELQERACRLERIIATQRDIAAAASGDLEHVMQVIVERAQALTRAEGAMVSLIDGDDMVTRAACGIASSFLHNRRPMTETVSRFAIWARRAMLIEHAENDPRLNRGAAQAGRGSLAHLRAAVRRRATGGRASA